MKREAPTKRGFGLAKSDEPSGALPALLASVQNHLQESLVELDDRLATRRQIARKIELLLREILMREIKSSDLRNEFDLFLSQLCAGEAITKIGSRLMQYVDATIYEDSALSDLGLVYSRQVALDLQDFVDWYTRRRATLAQFDSSDGDALSGLRIVHDRVVSGLRGMEVLSSIRLNGHLGQTLWYKARLMVKGAPVTIRDGWETWTDDTGRLTLATSSSGREFVVMQPIQPVGQLCLIDQARLFIPYSALELNGGTQEVDILVTVTEPRGAILLESEVSSRIAIPPQERSDAPIPSPHALALWRSDSAEGDSIFNVKASVGVVDGMNVDGQMLSVSFDLRLYNRDSTAVKAEFRVMALNGETIAGGDAHETALALFPQRPISRYFDLEFHLPVAELGLAKGRHDLLCEIVVLAENGQSICGTMEPVKVEVVSEESSMVEFRGARLLSHEDPSLGVQCTDFSVNFLSSFSNEGVIRVTSTLNSSDWTHRFLLVRVCIEDDRGNIVNHRRDQNGQLIRAIYVGGVFGVTTRTVVNNFDIADFELPDPERLRQNRELPYRARIRIYNNDGQQILEASRTFKLACDIFPREVRSLGRLEGLHIADLALRRISGERNNVIFQVAVNAKLDSIDSGMGTLYLELFSESDPIENGDMPIALPGRVIPIDLTALRSSPGFKPGWYQANFEAVIEIKGADICAAQSVKAMLFSTAGKLLQSIRQRVDDEGLRKTVDTSAGGVAREEQATEAAAQGVVGLADEAEEKVRAASTTEGEELGAASGSAVAAATKEAANTGEVVADNKNSAEATPKDMGGVATEAAEKVSPKSRTVKADLFSGSIAAVLSYRINVSGLGAGDYSLIIRFLDLQGAVVADREQNSGLRVYDGLHEFIEVGALEFVRTVILTGREEDLSGKLRVALNRFKLRAGEQFVQADIRLLGTRGEVVFSELRRFRCKIPAGADGLIGRLFSWISGR